MNEKTRHPGKGHRGDVDDQHRAGEVSNGKSNRVACLPVWSLISALDHLDRLGLCAYWTASRGCRYRRWATVIGLMFTHHGRMVCWRCGGSVRIGWACWYGPLRAITCALHRMPGPWIVGCRFARRAGREGAA